MSNNGVASRAILNDVEGVTLISRLTQLCIGSNPFPNFR